MKMNPPTCTAQEHKVRVVKNKPVFYDTKAIKDAKNLFCYLLMNNAPDNPLEGALFLKTMWLFPRGKHKNGEYRSTKPDTDNIQKILKDCMTKCGFWKDDSQVAFEVIEKRWSDEPCGIYVEIEQLR